MREQGAGEEKLIILLSPLSPLSPPYPPYPLLPTPHSFIIASREASPTLATLQGISRKNYLVKVDFELNN